MFRRLTHTCVCAFCGNTPKLAFLLQVQVGELVSCLAGGRTGIRRGLETCACQPTCNLRSQHTVGASFTDNGGRRSGIERREFSYAGYLPERRKGKDRRSGQDRRVHVPVRRQDERRAVFLKYA